jgi:hypothetical protein
MYSVHALAELYFNIINSQRCVIDMKEFRLKNCQKKSNFFCEHDPKF